MPVPLMYKHKLIDLPDSQPEAQRQIIEDPFDIGHEVPVIEQKKINFEDFRIQRPEELHSNSEPTRGQEVLREEIERLNEEISELRLINEIGEEMLADTVAEVEKLKNENIGLRAVLSYLESKINGTAV